MHFLLLSIACSVAVSVLFKLARQAGIDLRQTILLNYALASALCLGLLRPDLGGLLHQPGLPWPLLVALGVLLPAVFIAMASSVREAGIVRSDAAQRLSLIIPLIAAFTLFGEVLLLPKLWGIVLGLAALGCLLYKPTSTKQVASTQGWRYLLAVWLGYGLIDLLFKRLALAGAGFASSLLLAFLLAGALLLAYLFWRRVSWQGRALLLGLPLGLLNFGNILFYIRAHQHFSQSPALVFASMNIGVIAVGTLVGALVFREPLRTMHWLGLGLAVGAVLCLLP